MALGGRGLKKVDYNQLLAEAAEYQATAHQQAGKLKTLSKSDSKGAWLLRLHWEVWQREWEGLVKEVARVEGEMERWRAAVLTSPRLTEEVSECMAGLYKERREFEQALLSELRPLLGELKRWVCEGGGICEQELDVLRGRIHQVKQQLCEVGGELKRQCGVLRCEVQEFERSLCWDSTGTGSLPNRAAPESIQKQPCANTAFKKSLMAEFEKLGAHYDMILEQLSQRHSVALRYGVWV